MINELYKTNILAKEGHHHSMHNRLCGEERDVLIDSETTTVVLGNATIVVNVYMDEDDQ